MGKKKLDPGISHMRRKIGAYKRNAKKRKLEWNLTEEHFTKITQQDCYYCGIEPNNIAKQKGKYGEYTYNGLDRVDNTKGYTVDNVVPCCKFCNMAKNNHTLQEYKDWIKRSYCKIFFKENLGV